ncbi:hypothetical protein [Streptomyces cavernicola]|uniref:PDGLE domain-containing protein n=1 Tax=Streptomyces cavernicola TaxID=3043613 RepID=A0ABT6S2N6_9ACTN|nr:hypothetical protein [Streptomyces sp. B-S-A6]MDI3402351.1 hypothetical protein [Streptomyces sp. B-S-A6]
MRFPARSTLSLATLACGGLAVWAATAQYKAKQCLDGELHSALRGASITEQGCEMTTASGSTILVPISGPPFEAALAGAAGFVVLGVAAWVVFLRHARRVRNQQQHQ